MRFAVRVQLVGMVLSLLALGGCSDGSGGSGSSYTYDKPPYTNVDNAELKALIEQGVPVYDIRRPDEWRQTGVVEGSHLLTFVDGRGQQLPDFFPRLTQEVAKDAPVVLICRTGNRTSAAARYLATQLGYTKVYNVRDGITGWMREGNPVVHN